MKGVDDRTRELLQARAGEISRRRQVADRSAPHAMVAVVEVAGEQMGLPSSSVRAVVRVPPITPLPGLPAWMPGLVQLGGRILGVLDMARWLELPAGRAPAYLVLLEHSRRALGLLVDAVSGVLQIFPDEIAEQLSSADAAGGLPISFTTRDLVNVIDVDRLFTLADRRSNGSAGVPPRSAPEGLP
jgi:purine-binding chemotaxis protein CheW